MGEYNPHLPQILGNEWVGIKDEALTFSPAVNAVEIGHQFTLEANRQVSQGRFYVKDQPDGQSANQVYMMNIYPAGTEDKSGPIRRALIPVNTAAITGTFGNGTAANIPTLLLSPAGNSGSVLVSPSASATQKSLALFFDANRYAQELNGKRIVGVNLLHLLTWNPVDPNTGNVADKVAPLIAGTSLTLRTGAGVIRQFQYSPTPYFYIIGSEIVGVSSLLALPDVAIGLPGSGQVSTVQMGDVNYLWSTPANTSTQDVMPWRYEELQRFEATAGSNRYWIQYDFGASTQWAGEYYLAYAALEVLFCEEQRVIYGGRNCSTLINNMSAYDVETVILNLRSASALAANPVLTTGDYTVTVASANVGDVDGTALFPVSEPAANNPYPTLNALRELYPVNPQAGVQINLEDTEGQEFTKESSAVLPQLSLHASGGNPLVEPHAYGVQAAAQVYGTITAAQDINGGSGFSYQWVRYYARRFGNTTVPLLLSSNIGGAATVALTPSAFDALDEIVDGWKEVTLQFATPVTMTAQPTWTWSATGETAGNRWEVLGNIAPAISGIPGNILNLVPSAQRLTLATYGNDATVIATWMPGYAPPVSGATADPSTDAVLMFAQTMPTVTGFTAGLAEQEITGIGLDCGIDPCCIPTAIDYVQLSWNTPDGIAVFDSFSRTVVNGWGSAESGQTYTLSGGAASDYQVNNGTGQHLLANNRASYVNADWTDVDASAVFRVDQLATGASIAPSIMIRVTDPVNDMYVFEAVLNTDQTIQSRIRKIVGGSATTLATGSAGFTHTTAGTFNIHAQVIGSTLRLNVWPTTEEEPTVWQAVAVDTTFTAGDVGLRSLKTSGNTNVGAIVYWDDFLATPFYLAGSRYEIQRMDTVETDWKTIMMATDLTTISFKDYEARVGILSSYRIRLLDPYDFEGPWSATTTATVPEPGVTIGCTDGHLLIFTSNEEQDGSINLAYSSVWENQVEEDFTFPEARFVQLQAMYNRDFFTAFRPTERGGEQFSRTVLVQAAAISPETLADFTGLRDMAWANVSYICVRDEDGNRWFATVLVPSGRVLRDRRLYMAPVEIIEVTDTPSQVNP